MFFSVTVSLISIIPSVCVVGLNQSTHFANNTYLFTAVFTAVLLSFGTSSEKGRLKEIRVWNFQVYIIEKKLKAIHFKNY